MITIRYMEMTDKPFWYRLDKHLPESEFENKVETKRGYGKMLMEHWEEDMKKQGYGMLLVSTQVDEDAQHFYRKLGYRDCGGLIITVPEFAQPMELFMEKKLS